MTKKPETCDLYFYQRDLDYGRDVEPISYKNWWIIVERHEVKADNVVWHTAYIADGEGQEFDVINQRTNDYDFWNRDILIQAAKALVRVKAVR